MEEFRDAGSSPDLSRRGFSSMSLRKWKPPEEGMLKVNWDAALDVQAQRMGVGMLVQWYVTQLDPSSLLCVPISPLYLIRLLLRLLRWGRLFRLVWLGIPTYSS
ncbi:hypothetical protein SLA2020_390000 [Shorea laevis]